VRVTQIDPETADASARGSGGSPQSPGHSDPADRVIELAKDIKLAHSVFALPFALLVTFLAPVAVGFEFEQAMVQLPNWGQVACVVLCMFFARCVAMLANRWADANFDAENPRTKDRAIPAGRVPKSFALDVLGVCVGLFMVSCAGFLLVNDPPNAYPVLLGPFVLAWLIGYSFAKRYTWLCHLMLGIALGLSPIAAAVAIAPNYLTTPQPWVLAVMVTCWGAGFDIIYALQDVEIDRRQGLFSLPVRLGEAGAMKVSRFLHLIAVGCLAFVAWRSKVLGMVFAIGVGVVALLLFVEHLLVWNPKGRRINAAFFTVNGLISLVLGGLGIVEAVRVALAWEPPEPEEPVIVPY